MRQQSEPDGFGAGCGGRQSQQWWSPSPRAAAPPSNSAGRDARAPGAPDHAPEQLVAPTPAPGAIHGNTIASVESPAQKLIISEATSLTHLRTTVCSKLINSKPVKDLVKEKNSKLQFISRGNQSENSKW